MEIILVVSDFNKKTLQSYSLSARNKVGEILSLTKNNDINFVEDT